MAGGGDSPPREAAGRAEWLRIYDRMVAILRKNHRHVEALLADRARLEALVKLQHQFWVARDGLLKGRLQETRRTEECVRRCNEARLKLLLGDKDRVVRRYKKYAKHQDDDLEDFKTCAAALAEENSKLKLKLEEVENSGELSEKTTEHEHSGRNWGAEIREIKKAYKNLSLKKDKEVSALLAEKDFVWNQYKIMEKDYDSLLKKKKIEASQATEAAQNLQRKVEELQLAAQKKDADISRLRAEANGANKRILLLENKLQKLHSMACEEDDKAKKLKDGHLQATQKRKQDIKGTEGAPLRGESKNNAWRQMVEDQPETSQKRQCASSLSNAVCRRCCSSRMHLKPATSPAPQQALFRSSFKAVGRRCCSSRMHLKPATSPAPQQALFRSSFKVAELKTPTLTPPL